MLEILYLNSFKKDYKLAKKRGKNISKLKTVIEIIAEGKKLPEKYKDHQLKGSEYKGCRECHIEPDWLLVCRSYWSFYIQARTVICYDRHSPTQTSSSFHCNIIIACL